jgi:hypothetical protein
MNILSITAGAAGMYCGSCLRDNALAVELLRRGHTVTLLPLYTPTNPDETIACYSAASAFTCSNTCRSSAAPRSGSIG